MLKVLSKGLATIYPERQKLETTELRTKITEAYHQSKVRDHQRLLQRHKMIEERKEWLEKLNSAQQEAAIEKSRQDMERRKAGEARRLKDEQDEREKLRRPGDSRTSRTRGR